MVGKGSHCLNANPTQNQYRWQESDRSIFVFDELIQQRCPENDQRRKNRNEITNTDVDVAEEDKHHVDRYGNDEPKEPLIAILDQFEDRPAECCEG